MMHQTRQDKARQDTARQGKVRESKGKGKVREGKARYGKARQDMADISERGQKREERACVVTFCFCRVQHYYDYSFDESLLLLKQWFIK